MDKDYDNPTGVTKRGPNGGPSVESRPPKPVNPRDQAILNRPLGTNGLMYRDWTCELCGYYLTTQAILIGELREKCRNCKHANVKEFNRIGEEALLAEMNASKDTPGV